MLTGRTNESVAACRRGTTLGTPWRDIWGMRAEVNMRGVTSMPTGIVTHVALVGIVELWAAACKLVTG